MKYLLSILILATFFTYSQEIDATVNVDMEALDQEAQILVSTMASDLEKYIDNTRFTNDEWEGEKIPVDITIVLTGGFNGRFTGRFLLNSQRLIYGGDGESTPVCELMDQQWVFEYQMGAFHSYNPLRFDSFISLVDYYMLLVIGSDLDTYMDLGGTDAYEQARQICLLGASANAPGYETFNEPGEFTRYNHVSEVLDPRFEQFRILVASFYSDGIDYLLEDPETAKENLRIVIGQMADFKAKKLSGPSVVLQAFFQANSKPLGSLFNGYESESLFKDLYYLDPSNSRIYQAAQEGEN